MDPRETTWYLQARDPARRPPVIQLGTAVAVWLRDKDETGPGGRFLLTCGHVVRGDATSGMPARGWGRALPEIRAWAPGSSVTELDGGHVEASVLASPLGRGPAASDPVDVARRTAANDWVVLALDDPAQHAGASATAWHSGPLDPATRLTLVGFPAGLSRNEKVLPVQAEGFALHDSESGVFQIVGPGESRQGMSGGGYFAPSSGLAALHRSREDPALQQQGIDAAFLRGQLEALGFRVQDPPLVGPPPVEGEAKPPEAGVGATVPAASRMWIYVAIGALVLIAAVRLVWWPQTPELPQLAISRVILERRSTGSKYLIEASYPVSVRAGDGETLRLELARDPEFTQQVLTLTWPLGRGKALWLGAERLPVYARMVLQDARGKLVGTSPTRSVQIDEAREAPTSEEGGFR